MKNVESQFIEGLLDGGLYFAEKRYFIYLEEK